MLNLSRGCFSAQCRSHWKKREKGGFFQARLLSTPLSPFTSPPPFLVGRGGVKCGIWKHTFGETAVVMESRGLLFLKALSGSQTGYR